MLASQCRVRLEDLLSMSMTYMLFFLVVSADGAHMLDKFIKELNNEQNREPLCGRALSTRNRPAHCCSKNYPCYGYFVDSPIEVSFVLPSVPFCRASSQS